MEDCGGIQYTVNYNSPNKIKQKHVWQF